MHFFILQVVGSRGTIEINPETIKMKECIVTGMRLYNTSEVYTITKTCLYNFDPLKPHFYIVKLGFTGVYIIFLLSAQKRRLWVLVRTASPRRF